MRLVPAAATVAARSSSATKFPQVQATWPPEGHRELPGIFAICTTPRPNGLDTLRQHVADFPQIKTSCLTGNMRPTRGGTSCNRKPPTRALNRCIAATVTGRSVPSPCSGSPWSSSSSASCRRPRRAASSSRWRYRGGSSSCSTPRRSSRCCATTPTTSSTSTASISTISTRSSAPSGEDHQDGTKALRPAGAIHDGPDRRQPAGARPGRREPVRAGLSRPRRGRQDGPGVHREDLDRHEPDPCDAGGLGEARFHRGDRRRHHRLALRLHLLDRRLPGDRRRGDRLLRLRRCLFRPRVQGRHRRALRQQIERVMDSFRSPGIRRLGDLRRARRVDALRPRQDQHDLLRGPADVLARGRDRGRACDRPDPQRCAMTAVPSNAPPAARPRSPPSMARRSRSCASSAPAMSGRSASASCWSASSWAGTSPSARAAPSPR